MIPIQALFGIAAGIVSFIAYPIYFVDIIKGNTKPSRVTWWVLTLLNIALSISYFASGARTTIWIPISYSVGFFFVALLSLKYGEGSWEKSDLACLAGAILSIAVWFLSRSPEIALYFIIATDFIGLAPTIYKSFKRPWTESRLSWSVAAAASLLNIFAIETWSFAIAFYPVYVFATNAVIVMFLLQQKKPSEEGAAAESSGVRIPEFPTFKKLELSDKNEIDLFTNAFPKYSDYEFASLWAWDIKNEMEICWLNKNLVIKFNDYVTGTPFFSFLGENKVDDTARTLVNLSIFEEYGSQLALIPEVTAGKLNATKFTIEESRDHFDYIFELERFITFTGTKLKSRRNFLNGFMLKHPNYEMRLMDLTKKEEYESTIELCNRWEDNKGVPIPNETRALKRFLDSASSYEYVVPSVWIEGKLAAFCIVILVPGACAMGLFAKADTHYHGIYTLLMHEIAKELLRRNYTHLNHEQDLGIENLRQSKKAFDPEYFLKKYNVSLVGQGAA
jgi:hypothetical protein